MTVVSVYEIEVFTDRKLTKLSSSASFLSGLALGDTGVTAVIKSLAYYSKTFGSSYDVFF